MTFLLVFWFCFFSIYITEIVKLYWYAKNIKIVGNTVKSLNGT